MSLKDVTLIQLSFNITIEVQGIFNGGPHKFSMLSLDSEDFVKIAHCSVGPLILRLFYFQFNVPDNFDLSDPPWLLKQYINSEIGKCLIVSYSYYP